MAHKKLYRDIEHSSIGGVASGLADFFDLDVMVFRVLFIITAIFGGGVIVYLVLWIILPPKLAVVQSQADVKTETPEAVHQADTESSTNKKKLGLTSGLILIVLGIIFLINVFSDLHFKELWPILVIALGVIIVVSGFNNKKSKS
jgi:phage shock protein PspC (stress-responsive transcriptional regulator)